jgi:RNA polymerase sigma factor (sigma-70 family)
MVGVGRRRATDPRSVEAVYDALAPAVLGYFRSHRMADPEGLTGDVFVAVARRLHDFVGDDDALRRWVFTIAHNVGVDEIRRRSRQPALVPLEGTDAAGVDDEPFDPALTRALATLTEEQRQVVVLRHVADLSVADVAEITGRSQSAVKMLTTRGLEALARHLDATPAPSDEGAPVPRP